VAYNAGRQSRAEGLNWEALTPGALASPMPALSPSARRILSSQGPAFFSRWALRGYFEP